jgi:effector-binding domain-containing protein
MQNPAASTHRFEDAFIISICDTIPQWKVQRIAFSFPDTSILDVERLSDVRYQTIHSFTYPQFTSTREILSVFVKANGHYSVGGVKCFFNTVAVMDVDVDIEDTLVVSGNDSVENACVKAM